MENYNVFEAAKAAGAEIIQKSFLRGIEYSGKCQEAYDILVEKIPGFEKYYEEKSVNIDAWTDMYTLDGVEYAVYGEGELSRGDSVIALKVERK